MNADALERLHRHQLATNRPDGDLAWWLWDLAHDDVGPQVMDRLGEVRKADDIGRLLLRRRVLTVGTPPSLDAIADSVLQRWGRRISRQALHNRELDLRRELEPALSLVDDLAVTAYLEQRLAEATHVDDLDGWERAVLNASSDPDAAWPGVSDVGAAVSTMIGRRRSTSDGWWFNCSPGTTTAEGMRHVVERLRSTFPNHDLVPGDLRSVVESTGTTYASGERLAERVISDELAIETEEGTVLFPTAGSTTIADRLLHLHHVLGITFDGAAELLIDQHHANRGSLANAVRDLKRRGDLESPTT